MQSETVYEVGVAKMKAAFRLCSGCACVRVGAGGWGIIS